MNSKSYETLRKLSCNRFSLANFTTLKHLARNSVGHPDNFLLNEMAMVIDIFNQLDSKVGKTKTLIEECVLKIKPPILTSLGIDIDSDVVILAEFGDSSKYKNFAEYYAKKRTEGKIYRVALSHTTKKLLRVAFAIQTKNLVYDPNAMR